MCAHQPITAPTGNFLHVSAQMHNLDKQKTASSCKTLCPIAMTTYKLFLDDIRTVDMVYKNWSDKDFIIVRNFEDFKKTIMQKGLPEYISFDNDLGEDESGQVLPDGYHAAKWLVYESGLDLSKLNFYVHSANPVASKQIQGLLDNYIRHLRDESNEA